MGGHCTLGRGLKRSGVDPPLSSSRACLHTAFIAFSFRSHRRPDGSIPVYCSLTSLDMMRGWVRGFGGRLKMPAKLRSVPSHMVCQCQPPTDPQVLCMVGLNKAVVVRHSYSTLA